jgi:hypothetical protein
LVDQLKKTLPKNIYKDLQSGNVKPFLKHMKKSFNKGDKSDVSKIFNGLLKSGVNFTNVLCTHFLYKSLLHSFSQITVCFVIFWQKNIGVKVACKML